MTSSVVRLLSLLIAIASDISGAIRLLDLSVFAVLSTCPLLQLNAPPGYAVHPNKLSPAQRDAFRRVLRPMLQLVLTLVQTVRSFRGTREEVLRFVRATINASLVLLEDRQADETLALEVLAQDSTITVQDDLTILSPSYPTDTAIIFYPGAKVEAAAYLPLLNQLRQTGLTCILVEMPFHLAIFDVNAAEDVMSQFPDIQHWYIAGHSMGGAMASQFASEHPDEVDGLILLGAYLYGDYPPADTLTVYGSLNQSVEDKIDYTENVVEIEGGNHAQFGNYGPQKGDLPATISAEEQQAQTVEAISDFIAQRQK